MKKKCIALFLALAMVLTMLPMTMAAEGDVAAIGDVTYPTLSAALLAAKGMTGDVEIDLLSGMNLSEWTSVDMRNAACTSLTIDGNEKLITGLTQPLICNLVPDLTVRALTFTGVNVTGNNSNGMTGAGVITAGTAVDQNVTLDGVIVSGGTISSSDFAGVLIGYFQGHNDGVLTITGCTVSGVTISSSTGGAVGALVGHLDGCTATVTETIISANTLNSSEDGAYREDKTGAAFGTILGSDVSIAVTVLEKSNIGGTALDKVAGRMDSAATLQITGGTYPADPLKKGTDKNSLTDIVPVGNYDINVTAPADKTFAPNAAGNYILSDIIDAGDVFFYNVNVGQTAMAAEGAVNELPNLSDARKAEIIEQINALADEILAEMGETNAVVTADLLLDKFIRAIRDITGAAETEDETVVFATVRFDANGGACEYGYTTTDANGTISFLPTATREGYTFEGWFTAPEGGRQVTAGTAFDRSTTVYAHWLVQEDIYVPYIDVPTDAWYFDSVMFAYYKGLMNGVSTYEFAPNKTLNRATLLTTLWRLSGSPKVSGGNTFTDLQEGTWYTDAMKWAIANGIIEGYGNGQCRPLQDVTHQEVCAILRRYASLNGRNVNAPSWAYNAPKYSTWAKDDALWAVNNGVYATFGSDVSDLTKTATRGEVAAYLQVICELLGK